MPPTIASGTGTATDGASVTLTGSGFGSKPQAAPFVFDTFADCGDGAGLDGVNGWSTEGDAAVTTVGDPVRPGSARAVQLAFAPSDSSHNFWRPQQMNAGVLYFDFWVWFKLRAGSNFPENYKMFRLYNTIYEGPNTYQGYAGGAIIQTDQKGAPMAEPPYYSWWTGPSIEAITAGYAHAQYELVMGADPAVGGTMKIWVNGGAQMVPTNAMDKWQHRQAGDPETWASILFGNYAYSTANGFDVYFSDVYLDTSRARVEIGNAASYDQCTHREIVPLTAHSDGSLTCTLRKGALPSYDGCHLFVVNDAGEASEGFALASLGAGGGIVDPPPVTGSITHTVACELVVTPDPLAADFAMSVAPSVQDATSPVVYRVTVAAVGGFSDDVKLTLDSVNFHSGGSTAISESFDPQTIAGQGTSTLTIQPNSGGQTPMGTTTLTVTGKSKNVQHSAMASMIMTPAQAAVMCAAVPDFALSVEPSQQTVTSGETTSFLITVTPSDGFAGTVALTSDLGTCDPASVASAGTSTLTVSATDVGTHTVTVTGTSG